LIQLGVYAYGAFAYPYLEDDDSWSHAKTVEYITETGKLTEPYTNKDVFGYLDPRPPVYDLVLSFFHLFLPIGHLHEINTYIIKEFLESTQKKVYTSVIQDGLDMKTVVLNSDTMYAEGRFGVPVPVPALEVEPKILEVVLVPLLAFDRAGNRIGFGKGYYDVFLSHLRPEVIKLGLSYFSPEEKIPCESHDVRLDFCLTKEAIFRF
jgi:5-formyltetrahydrofolate cyclo-ligase